MPQSHLVVDKGLAVLPVVDYDESAEAFWSRCKGVSHGNYSVNSSQLAATSTNAQAQVRARQAEQDQQAQQTQQARSRQANEGNESTVRAACRGLKGIVRQ